MSFLIQQTYIYIYIQYIYIYTDCQYLRTVVVHRWKRLRNAYKKYLRTMV